MSKKEWEEMSLFDKTITIILYVLFIVVAIGAVYISYGLGVRGAPRQGVNRLGNAVGAEPPGEAIRDGHERNDYELVDDTLDHLSWTHLRTSPSITYRRFGGDFCSEQPPEQRVRLRLPKPSHVVRWAPSRGRQ
jgi:hypothetical protein